MHLGIELWLLENVDWHAIIADFMHTTIKKTTYLKKQSTQMSLDKDNAHEKEYKFTNWNKVSFH